MPALPHKIYLRPFIVWLQTDKVKSTKAPPREPPSPVKATKREICSDCPDDVNLFCYYQPVVLEEPKPPFRPNPTEVAANRVSGLFAGYAAPRQLLKHMLLSRQAAAVQKELQKYLDSKNFNTMFTAMVEHLLNSRPEDPVSSIIEYLFERFPDSARMAKIR